ncbi:hypothetical protein ACND55_003965 [Escherichia coli]
MTDPGDELQASHPLRDGKVIVEDIEDKPGIWKRSISRKSGLRSRL